MQTGSVFRWLLAVALPSAGAVAIKGDGSAPAPDAPPAASERKPDAGKPPRPPAARERAAERLRMVEAQIARPLPGREAVTRADVLEAMRAVPRHAMVPDHLQRQAYDDTPLPIGHGQTISQPYMVAVMTELLELTPDSRVLEIGTGSGYQAAVLAHLTPHVFSIEIVKPLLDRARQVLQAQGYDRVQVRHADGYLGWPEQGPYDAIIVTCAAGHVPPPLWQQLKPGGRMVIPIGSAFEVQRLVVLTKGADGSRTSRAVMPVRFVPLTRAAPAP